MSGKPEAMTEYRPYAMWTNDCQGKQDFDGPLISVSTRYYPGPDGGGTMMLDTGTGKIRTLPYGPKPSARSSVLLNYGPREKHDGGGDYMVLAEEEFEGDTEADVKAKVETWAASKMNWIVTALASLGMKATEP